MEINELTVSYNISNATINSIPDTPDAIAAVFEAVSECGVNVDMISKPASRANDADVSFTFSDDGLTHVLAAVSKLKKRYPEIDTDVKQGRTKILLCGDGMREQHGVAAKVFRTISDFGAEIDMITTAETEISILINSEHSDGLVKELKKRFSLN